MSNVAKVFIVINFVLSIVYLAVAGTLLAQKWDYRQMLLDAEKQHAKQLTEIKEEKHALETEVKNCKNLLEQSRQSAREFKNDYNREKESNSELKRQNNEMSRKLQEISDKIKIINDKFDKKDETINELTDELDKQKKLVEKAIKERTEAKEEQQRVEILLSNLEGALAEKENIIQRIQKELWETKQIVRVVKKSGINISSLIKPHKPMDGQIVAVSESLPVVMLSLGLDDGVEKGYQFTVYRGSKYIGRVVVDEAYKDMSAAKIVKEMTVKSIQKGDSVTTRIGGGSY